MLVTVHILLCHHDSAGVSLIRNRPAMKIIVEISNCKLAHQVRPLRDDELHGSIAYGLDCVVQGIEPHNGNLASHSSFAHGLARLRSVCSSRSKDQAEVRVCLES